ncbi:HD domain-containing phosphohydrolase [Peribacillus deserti]|uniref:Phosphohydrolase n=1 Tax=Peribacillus deserti TaxID=673318 RepID=A0A2N5M7Q9_9BACI|nr:HD domain-containing phosphohydrolase [Peribacillus deserti]PLT30404.1 phosphohydrolase [Peribacillus deserti]
MEGLYLGSKDTFIEKANNPDSTEFRLLAKGDGSEVIYQTIRMGKSFYLYPGDVSNTLEFFYIIEGTCVYETKERSISLRPGEHFYIHNLKEPAYFLAQTDMQLLWFTTQPAFHYVSASVGELTKVLKQIEEKDHYTYSHSVRVQAYSLRIAKELQLSKDILENLYFASVYHDVGKIHIPEDILNKPGKLTPEEFEILKKHSADGCQMVKSTYYSHIGEIILQHHERLDGSGYPSGLMGGEISLEAQIIGIADTFDAMVSDRVYRKGMDPEIAINEIKSLKNRHYEANIVDAFEKVLIQDGRLSEKMEQKQAQI